MLTQERAKSLLALEEDGRLRWIDHYQRPDLIGKLAGSRNQGYWRLAVDGVQYYACQIVWLIVYGYIPDVTIDHEDQDGYNDRPGNLRLSTKGQNAMNSRMNSRNTSGLKGVSMCSSTGQWRADIRVNGKSKNLGRYNSAQEAHLAWRSEAIKAFGEEFVSGA